MKEYPINQYLSVRLERGTTRIYVLGKPFLQCKYLLLNIPIVQLNSFDEIESIDDAAENLDNNIEKEMREIAIPPEVEFWGHCSNLQAWYENEYDSRLIHSNLALPLLTELMEAGDSLARKVFVSEVLERYRKGTEKTRDFIRKGGIMEHLPLDEQFNLLLDSETFIALKELVREIWNDRDPYEIILSLIVGDNVILKNKKVIELNFSSLDLELNEFPKSILNLKNLETFYLGCNYVKEIPEEIIK